MNNYNKLLKNGVHRLSINETVIEIWYVKFEFFCAYAKKLKL